MVHYSNEANFKELLRNKFRFTLGWAEVMSMDHIVQILNWARPDLRPSLLYVIIMCMHTVDGCGLRSASGDKTYSISYSVLPQGMLKSCDDDIWAIFCLWRQHVPARWATWNWADCSGMAKFAPSALPRKEAFWMNLIDKARERHFSWLKIRLFW